MAEPPKTDHTGARIPDDHFAGDELLYRRFMRDAYSASRPHVDISAISLPDMSVNRSKYSVPDDVISEFPDFGVAAFRVDEIPDTQPVRGVAVYTYKAVHKPVRKNYAHSEVRCFKEGEHLSWTRDTDDEEIEEMHYMWRHRLQQVLKVVTGPPQDDAAA